jgi:alpha-amylase
MIGQREYFTNGNNCAVVCRETGAVVVAGSGGDFQVTVPNGGSLTQLGTYIDTITGAKWTVTASTMTGKIGSTGIAVLYKEDTYKPSTSTGNEGSTGSTGNADSTDNAGSSQQGQTGTIYYKNTNNWSTVYAYYWSSTNTELTTWPGVMMTRVEDGVYRIEVPKEAEYIIFSMGSNAAQTEDIPIEGWNKIYQNGTWSDY